MVEYCLNCRWEQLVGYFVHLLYPAPFWVTGVKCKFWFSASLITWNKNPVWIYQEPKSERSCDIAANLRSVLLNIKHRETWWRVFQSQSHHSGPTWHTAAVLHVQLIKTIHCNLIISLCLCVFNEESVDSELRRWRREGGTAPLVRIHKLSEIHRQWTHLMNQQQRASSKWAWTVCRSLPRVSELLTIFISCLHVGDSLYVHIKFIS